MVKILVGFGIMRGLNMFTAWNYEKLKKLIHALSVDVLGSLAAIKATIKHGAIAGNVKLNFHWNSQRNTMARFTNLWRLPV